jgi:hypothetical protein
MPATAGSRQVQVSSAQAADVDRLAGFEGVLLDGATQLNDANGVALVHPSGNPVYDSVFATLQDLVEFLAQTPAPTTVDPGSIIERLKRFEPGRAVPPSVPAAWRAPQTRSTRSRHPSTRPRSRSPPSRGSLKDADLAEAIGRFTPAARTALQATRQGFVRIQGLSLFNYL